MTRIGVVGVGGGWSSETLADAVAEKTGFRRLIDMSDVVLDLEHGRVAHDGFDLSELDAIIVKKIAPRYSPDTLDRLEILRCLAERGTPVFSHPVSIMRMLDRLSCTVSLHLAGIPMPATVVTEDLDAGVAAVERFGRAIGKPLYTSKARGMRVFEAGPSTRAELEEFREAGNPVLYLQQMLDIPGRDLGISFLGGKYLATYARVSSGASWDTTTRTGGKYEPAEPAPEVIALAERAQRPFDLAFTCVDVVETADGPKVFEVSAFGGFRGLKEACGIDVASLYSDWVLERVGGG